MSHILLDCFDQAKATRTCHLSSTGVNMRTIASVAFFSLLAAPLPSLAQPGFEEMWEQQEDVLLAEGIDDKLARQAFVWIQSQRHLGQCGELVSKADTDRWRNWWKSTRLAATASGKVIANAGDKQYEAGKRAGPLSVSDQPHCKRIFESTLDEAVARQQHRGATPAPASVEAAGCNRFVGEQVSSQSFAAVAAKLDSMPATRSEFETTEAFNSRQGAAAAQLPATFIVSYQPNLQYLVYDADAGALSVKSYFFRNRNTSYSDVFGYGSPFDGKVKYGHSDNIDVVVGETERPTGSYAGSNAYGATAIVTRIQRDTQSIWDREAKYGEDIFNGDAGVLLDSIPMQPNEARALKGSASAAIVFTPRWPYLAKGTKTWTPTINRPTHVTNDITVITGDIQCALLLDSTKRVLAAYATK